MANTFGGLILIGVAEDDEGCPVLPIAGIEFERGLEERVIQKVLSNIYPPFVPEVKACVREADQKTVVVIKIAQSQATPHAIAGRREIYLRTGNRNHPEDIATLERHEWLRDRRALSVQLKERILNASRERASKLYNEWLVTNPPRPGEQWHSFEDALLEFYAVPKFPYEIYGTPPRCEQLRRDFAVRDYSRTFDSFPFEAGSRRITQDSAIRILVCDNRKHYYFETGIYGNIFYRQGLLREEGGTQFIRAWEIIARLDQVLSYATAVYREFGFSGAIDLGLRITVRGGWPLREIDFGGAPPLSPFHNPLDPAISHFCEAPVAQLQAVEARGEIIADIFRAVAWGFDWNPPLNIVQRYFDRHRR